MVVVVVDGDAKSGPIQIEVAEPTTSQLEEVYGDQETRNAKDRIRKLARPLFAEAVDLASVCAVQVKQRLDNMTPESRPDEFEVQFAINMDATLGASIAGTSAGAQLQVCMRWTSAAENPGQDAKQASPMNQGQPGA